MQKVFAIFAGRMPNKIRHPFLRRLCEHTLSNMPGLIDWADGGTCGTMLFFGTRTHAEKAMDAMRKSHNSVGDQIYEVEQDLENRVFRVKGPIED